MRMIPALITIILSASSVSAETLSPVALYHRCYAHITQLRVPAGDSRLAAVKAGIKDPIAACLEVLDSARFTADNGTRVSNTSDQVALAVLRNFHSLHYSWFRVRQFEFLVGSAPNWQSATQDVFDPSSPALYYTKALFDPNFKFREVITSPENLRPVRTSNPSKGVYSRQPASAFTPPSLPEMLVQTGDLIGARPSGSMMAGGVDYGLTAGGGFLGTIPYIQLTVGGDLNFRSDGAVNVPRRWGRDIFLDVMCRELPVVRDNDVLSLVVSSASASFRKTANCTNCHASMDRMAGTLRNFKYVTATTNGHAYTPISVAFRNVTASAESSWPSSRDNSYASRPPNGVLFYRSYDGSLVNVNVTGIADLGAKIANEDDFYICAAKRYFHYFTGISAETGDIQDPNFDRSLSSSDKAVRDLVIELGKKLRISQNPRALIEEIMKLPQYKLSDYGLGNQ